MRWVLTISIVVAHSQVAPPATANQANNAAPQISAPTPVSAKDSVDLLLSFQRTLADQAKAHQDSIERAAEKHQMFLESWYSRICTWGGWIAVGFAALLAFFHFKSKGEVSREVQVLFENKASAIIAQKVREFEGELSSNREKVRIQVEELKNETTKDVDFVCEYAAVMVHAAMVLSTDPKSIAPDQMKRRANDARDRLEKFQTRAPLQRTTAIFVARLEKVAGDFDAAQKALKRVIEGRRKKGKPLDRDTDQAALLFNRACYLNVMGRQTEATVPKAGEKLRAEAWDVLKECVEIEPKNLEEAKSDDELLDIVNSGGRKWDDLKQ